MGTSHHRSWSSWIPETRDGLILLAVSPLIFYISYRIIVRRLYRLGLQRTSRRDDVDVANMTLEEAYAIKTRIAEDEFPRVFSAAINFVFFKAEGIPSIAKLVFRASQRSSNSNQKPRRGPGVSPADLLRRPGAPDTRAAIDRVNHVHSLFRPSGKMSDDDLLYVLSLFTAEPMQWIARFEYRALSDRERCALTTLWRAVGEELRIPYNRLPSYAQGFRDSLHWLTELEDWGCAYERVHRERTPESVALAGKQMDAWVGSVPGFIKGATRGFVAAGIEPGLRQAHGIETPSPITVFLVETVIYIRKIARRFL
ncbi:hypothetical protein F4678DRAFT_417225 [Xylaria arbuscula]|nr:hypothetical protein F4678DRAFT_417225 [Xylaria arbuscula]